MYYEQDERRAADYVQRVRPSPDNRSKNNQSEHQRRAHNRHVCADSDHVGPDEANSDNKLQESPPGHPSDKHKHQPRYETDVQTGDYQDVKSAAGPKSLGGGMRDVVSIPEQRSIQDACGFG